METVKVSIREFKDKLIQVGKENGLPENVIEKINKVYDYQVDKFRKNLPYKANEIMESYITHSYINIKVFLINVLMENTKETDPWSNPLKEVIDIYRVA